MTPVKLSPTLLSRGKWVLQSDPLHPTHTSQPASQIPPVPSQL